MTFWLKPWGRKDAHFEELPKGVITFPKHPGKPQVNIGDLLVIYGIGIGKLVAIMRATSDIKVLPDTGPGGRNERYPFGCDGVVHEGLDVSRTIPSAPSLDTFDRSEDLLGAIQHGSGHIELSEAEFASAESAIRIAIDANRT